MRKQRILLFFFLLLILSPVGWAEEELFPLEKAEVNLTDLASAQRGAKLFMNYCAGCHSLKYLRYNQMAKGLGLTTDDGSPDQDLLKNLMFTTAKTTDHVLTAIPMENAAEWFGGITPPDLSLEVRIRGADWIYTYLKSFYEDKTRPFATNNALYPQVAMPDVLYPLQGKQIAITQTSTHVFEGNTIKTTTIDHLQSLGNGEMSEQAFNSAIGDIVNFLAYVGEPDQLTRIHLGYWVIAFLIILLLFAYLLKKEYWKDIK